MHDSSAKQNARLFENKMVDLRGVEHPDTFEHGCLVQHSSTGQPPRWFIDNALKLGEHVIEIPFIFLFSGRDVERNLKTNNTEW